MINRLAPHPHPLPTGGRGAANPAFPTTASHKRLPSPSWGGDGGGGRPASHKGPTP